MRTFSCKVAHAEDLARLNWAELAGQPTDGAGLMGRWRTSTERGTHSPPPLEQEDVERAARNAMLHERVLTFEDGGN